MRQISRNCLLDAPSGWHEISCWFANRCVMVWWNGLGPKTCGSMRSEERSRCRSCGAPGGNLRFGLLHQMGGGRNSNDLKIHLFPGTSCANEEMSRLSRWISKTEGHFAILTWLFWRERRLGSSFGCSKGRQWNRDPKGVREQHLSSSGWARPGPRNIFGMKQVSKG